jgi:hypothetical protein
MKSKKGKITELRKISFSTKEISERYIELRKKQHYIFIKMTFTGIKLCLFKGRTPSNVN